MPRAAIQEQVVNTRAGYGAFGSLTTGDTVNGHFFTWSPNKVLFVSNATGGAVNVTMTPASQNLDGFTAPNRVVSSPNNSQLMIGPFPSAFAHPEDNDRVYVDVAAAVSIKVYELTEV